VVDGASPGGPAAARRDAAQRRSGRLDLAGAGFSRHEQRTVISFTKSDEVPRSDVAMTRATSPCSRLSSSRCWSEGTSFGVGARTSIATSLRANWIGVSYRLRRRASSSVRRRNTCPTRTPNNAAIAPMMAGSGRVNSTWPQGDGLKWRHLACAGSGRGRVGSCWCSLLRRARIFRYFASKEELVMGKYARPADEPIWVSLRQVFGRVVEPASRTPPTPAPLPSWAPPSPASSRPGPPGSPQIRHNRSATCSTRQWTPSAPPDPHRGRLDGIASPTSLHRDRWP